MSVTDNPTQSHHLYKARKEDLITLVSECQGRVFSEDVDFLERLGGK